MTALTGLDAWLHCHLTPGLGPAGWRRLLQAFGDAEAIAAASQGELATVSKPAIADAIRHGDSSAERARVHDWLAAADNRAVVTLADDDYPLQLAQLADPPPVLYLIGRRELLSRPMLAVVGSRHASAQGERDAGRFARAVGEAGYTVVSGLAAGIDAAAHRGALSTPAATVAVIGTGIDRIYPARNRELAHAIAAGGLIVSEFALGTPPLAANFPRRNRIIAGLAAGCLVVEANVESGSLITARLALEAGREVFAVPGSIHSPLARGCHALIRDGAKLTETTDDILTELPPLTPLPVAEPAGETAEDDPLLTILGYDPVDADTLAERAGLTVERLLAMLLPLELDGKIAALPGRRFQRVV